jgi:hypothetical protein
MYSTLDPMAESILRWLVMDLSLVCWEGQSDPPKCKDLTVPTSFCVRNKNDIEQNELNVNQTRPSDNLQVYFWRLARGEVGEGGCMDARTRR